MSNKERKPKGRYTLEELLEGFDPKAWDEYRKTEEFKSWENMRPVGKERFWEDEEKDNKDS